MRGIKRFTSLRDGSCRHEFIGVLEITDKYLVTFEERAPLGRPITLILSEYPQYAHWQPHPEEPGCRVIGYDCKRRKHSRTFDFTVRYSSRELPMSPLEEPARITVDTMDVTLPVFEDWEEQPLVYTNGMPIVDEDTFSFLVFNIRKKIDTSYPDWLLSYPQAVNADTVRFKSLPLEPRTLKVAKLTIGDEEEQEATNPEEDPIPYCELSMQIIHNPMTWDRFYLNRGIEEISWRRDDKNKLIFEVVPVLNHSGQPISEPVFLDNEGRRPRVDHNNKICMLQREIEEKLVTTVKQPLDKEDIVILRKQLRRPLPFSVLPIN